MALEVVVATMGAGGSKLPPCDPLSLNFLSETSHTIKPQPASEVFDMIEDLMLMESGKLTYFGTTSNARCFFDSLAGQCPSGINPAGTGCAADCNHNAKK